MSYDKYIKYKNKYLQLKTKYTQVGGGLLWVITNLSKYGKATEPITEKESNAINKRIPTSFDKTVEIEYGTLQDNDGNKINDYGYTIYSDGNTGTRNSFRGKYEMTLTYKQEPPAQPPRYASGAYGSSASAPPSRYASGAYASPAQPSRFASALPVYAPRSASALPASSGPPHRASAYAPPRASAYAPPPHASSASYEKFVSDNFDILFSKVKYTQVDVENFKIECNERYKEMYKKDMPDNVFNDIIKGFQFIYILGVKTIPKE